MENNELIPAELKGKVALVTGGTKGIGKAIAERLAKAGATPKEIRVLTVTPGMVKTEAMDGYLKSLSNSSGLSIDEVMQNAMKSIGGIPMGKMAEPEDVAELGSNPSAYYRQTQTA